MKELIRTRFIVLLVIFTLLFLILLQECKGNNIKDIDSLFQAIKKVESVNGTELSGDNGESLGPYHIQRKYWVDACEYGKVDWSYKDNVYNESKCKQVMKWYWERYIGKNYMKDLERCARAHNRGWSKKKQYDKHGDEYVRKIRRYL